MENSSLSEFHVLFVEFMYYLKLSKLHFSEVTLRVLVKFQCWFWSPMKSLTDQIMSATGA